MKLPPRWWKAVDSERADTVDVKSGDAMHVAGADAAARIEGAAGAGEAAASGKGRNTKAAQCSLCIHACVLTKDKSGYCGARFFDGEALVSPFLGRFSSIAIDPIEKKPLYHWRPGTEIFSLGSLGCTMRCPFCQNHGIAQPERDEQRALSRLREIEPEALAATVLRHKLNSVAYTYNEPSLQAEYILAAAPLLRASDIATVLVSNGMYSPELLEELVPFVAAANIDVKTFNPRTYARLGGSLDTVKRTVARFHEGGVHVEATTLVVPGVSDSIEEFDQLTAWLASISPGIPLHISRYRPAHRFKAPPTPIPLLERFAALAKGRLKHVHIGNVPGLR
ncbi:radical SAM protein [Desulfovibrio sp. OttesenSCG-928-A18]|nr:radical SAM protein [Desulfovibrio sp. OttesenSCG-928-A18]